jgi:hypothetical protein
MISKLISVNEVVEYHTGQYLLDGSIFRHHFLNRMFHYNPLLVHSVLLIHKRIKNAFSMEDEELLMRRLVGKCSYIL